ncbi:PhnD/SsuA/transferrin family substrate-binding protein [Falsiroseomonas sp. HW251]|uniref:PhnD/SsuA/transferrin family substrate-binding protein n=1 Tax=Falsiroseomonas sp. HW251 TaxID=3390998 RepID=UPI003D30EFE8
MSTKLRLSLACGDYDRTRPILDGRVEVEGCELAALPLTPEESFFRAFRHQAFDVAELSLSTYVMTTARGTCPYIAVPAFVSRSFRHSAIYVRRDRGIARPEDLRSKRIGVPEYQVTAAVWARAILEQEHGVRPQDLHWVSGGVEEPGRPEKVALSVPPGVELSRAPEGRWLSEMLAAGDLDALMCPRAPSCFDAGHPEVARLFADPAAAAAEWYRRRGIFPIMHVVGIRRSLVEAHPWLPQSVFKAFTAARDIALQRLRDTTALAVSLPFLVEETERTQALMGTDFWPYGLASNRETLDVFLQHHHAQGLSPRRLTAEELFANSALERFMI